MCMYIYVYGCTLHSVYTDNKMSICENIIKTYLALILFTEADVQCTALYCNLTVKQYCNLTVKQYCNLTVKQYCNLTVMSPVKYF